ncbi:unnamed protein product [Parnassius apollo]|uniref:(apollo) hypothetical protein n=1 Tax=Parnassius apollo TaxID=110799 RepID=A0A8S3XG00_PARAO|nr:unnamed protein product [Parnassius apollo]
MLPEPIFYLQQCKTKKMQKLKVGNICEVQLSDLFVFCLSLLDAKGLFLRALYNIRSRQENNGAVLAL